MAKSVKTFLHKTFYMKNVVGCYDRAKSPNTRVAEGVTYRKAVKSFINCALSNPNVVGGC